MRTEVIVVGAGQAGLAASRWLSAASVDHVVLERGEVARSWVTERWDSLRLLTPNWLSRLPGYSYQGPDPDGYMTAAEVAAHLRAFGRSFGAPVRTESAVLRVRRVGSGFAVTTTEAEWRTRAVVVAAGAASQPRLPAASHDLPARLHQLSPIHYRRPDSLPPGGVLVVGASASGVQIADELARHGRDVVLAVGEHTRVPRTYRGRDIHRWLDEGGLLARRVRSDQTAARPSLQLIGSQDRRSVDLNAVSSRGVRVVGRLTAIRGRHAEFADDLTASSQLADRRMHRLLDRIDLAASAGSGLAAETDRPVPTSLPSPDRFVDLGGIGTVIWATGFSARHPWLDQRWLDERGRLRQRGGVGVEPGLFALGLPDMLRRNSTFIDGVGADAREVVWQVRVHLDDVAVAA